MDNAQLSIAARQMASRRWGVSKPVRLARELALRASELPDPERVRLLNALDLAGRVNVTELSADTGSFGSKGWPSE
jgi:hypothetical protein